MLQLFVTINVMCMYPFVLYAMSVIDDDDLQKGLLQYIYASLGLFQIN